MARQYVCENRRRRDEVDDSDLNGIDYLEVLDRDALADPGALDDPPTGTPRQRTLLVRLLKTPEQPLSLDNVQIEGGVRITEIGVEWVSLASSADDLLADGLINQWLHDYLLAQPKPDHLLVVRTDTAGDFSTYVFSLVAGPTSHEPPKGFDTILASVEFSFKVECPSEFDCLPRDECPPLTPPAPIIDYLAKDYSSFRQLLLDRLAVLIPEWRERSPADLGVTIVELLAYFGDQLSYFQDAVGTEMYLGTARRRISLRRHGRLLDYLMHEGCNARAWVHFTVEGTSHVFLPAIDPGTRRPVRLLTDAPGGTVLSTTDYEKALRTRRVEVFQLSHDVWLFKAHNRIPFYTWSDEQCCLPRGATHATLADDPNNRRRLRVGDVLIFEETRDPGTLNEADANMCHRHAVRLKAVRPEATIDENGERVAADPIVDAVTGQQVVEVQWRQEDALPFPLCLSAIDEEGQLFACAVARGNIALVDHGRAVNTSGEEKLSPLADPSRYRPLLAEANITHKVPYRHEEAIKQAALRTIKQDPQSALPDATLVGKYETWFPQRDLLASDAFAAEFVLEMEDDRRGRVRFGDGIYARQPRETEKLEPRYRVGNGTAGNVGADAIKHVVTSVGGIGQLRNPLPAAGGIDPEQAERVRQIAPQAFRTQERAVTEQDYASVAERHSQVQKAAATRRWTGSWHTMFLTIDRRGGLPVDEKFERELRSFLNLYRLAGHDLEIDGPRFVSLEIVLSVCVAPGYRRDAVKEELLKVFSNHDLPDGTRGFFHYDNFTFGQPVYLSEVLATAMDVPGVRWVDVDEEKNESHRFRRWGELPRDEIRKGLIEMDRLEIARLDNDPSQPENGKMDFLMEGGV